MLEARHGTDALRVAEQYADPIHLLTTDLVMPGLSGRQLAERLTVVRLGLRALFRSGYTDEAMRRQGILEGDMPFLQKPFTTEGLARKVREVLDAH